MRFQSSWLLIVALNLCTQLHGADAPPHRVKVVAILGQAQASRIPGQYFALGPGMDVREGYTIQTANESAIDLDFGPGIGTVRLTESAAVFLEKVSVGNTESNTFEVILALKKGELLGNIKSVPSGSRVEVKITQGLAQALGGRFRVSDQAYLVVLEGQTLLAHLPTVGEPAAHSLKAPPPTYFSPAEGVRPAPKPLIREVEKQFKSKLPRR